MHYGWPTACANIPAKTSRDLCETGGVMILCVSPLLSFLFSTPAIPPFPLLSHQTSPQRATYANPIHCLGVHAFCFFFFFKS